MNVQSKYPKFATDQREIFDALISEEWHTYQSADWDATRRYEISQLFKRIRPKTILDIGCGCGFHDNEMAQYPFVQQVHAIDYSPKSIEKANEAYPHAKVRRWVGDLLVDKPNRTYDLVVSFQVFEHLADTGGYFRYCSEALNIGGHAAILTPNVGRLSNRARALRGLPPVYCDPQHFREYHCREITEIAAGHGFVEERKYGYGVSGLRQLDRLPIGIRLKLGSLFPSIANGVCVVLRKST